MLLILNQNESGGFDRWTIFHVHHTKQSGPGREDAESQTLVIQSPLQSFSSGCVSVMENLHQNTVKSLHSIARSSYHTAESHEHPSKSWYTLRAWDNRIPASRPPACPAHHHVFGLCDEIKDEVVRDHVTRVSHTRLINRVTRDSHTGQINTELLRGSRDCPRGIVINCRSALGVP